MRDEYNMKYFSESYFRGISSGMPLHEQRMFSDAVHRAPIDKQFDVFLSYNISDLNVVKCIYYALSKMGIKVYLDCIVDPNMNRSETNKETANL